MSEHDWQQVSCHFVNNVAIFTAVLFAKYSDIPLAPRLGVVLSDRQGSDFTERVVMIFGRPMPLGYANRVPAVMQVFKAVFERFSAKGT
jgi:hypothetical protein